MDDVIQAVQKTFDLSADGLESRSATTARQVAAYLAFEDALIVQSAIAHAFGLRSRGGVSSLVATCRAAIAANSELRESRRPLPQSHAPPPAPAESSARRVHLSIPPSPPRRHAASVKPRSR